MSDKHDPSMTSAQEHASDQRAQMRHKVYVHVISVAGDTVDRKAISGNLSRKGLFVATPEIVPVGTQVTVRFRLPNEDTAIEAVAEVAWTNEEKDFEAGKVPGYGVEFVELPEEHQERLDEYMDHFEPDDTDHA
jgi:uncharacterized protein (TIGR02266 family)